MNRRAAAEYNIAIAAKNQQPPPPNAHSLPANFTGCRSDSWSKRLRGGRTVAPPRRVTVFCKNDELESKLLPDPDRLASLHATLHIP